MDWHLLEISLVTILAIWVYLFSPSAVSRGVAVVMMVINIVWVLLDAGGRQARESAAEQPDPATADGEAANVEAEE